MPNARWERESSGKPNRRIDEIGGCIAGRIWITHVEQQGFGRIDRTHVDGGLQQLALQW